MLTTCVGSPSFMAPEIAHGEPYGKPADIWSVGCVAVELLSGAPPDYGAANPMALMYRLASDETAVPMLPAQASALAKDFVARCCSRVPSHRDTAVQLATHPWIAASHNQHEASSSASKAAMNDATKRAIQQEGSMFFPGADTGKEAQPSHALLGQRCDVGIALFTCDDCRRTADTFNLCPSCWAETHSLARRAHHVKRPLLVGRTTPEGSATKAGKPRGLLLAGGTFVDDFHDAAEECPVCGEHAHDGDTCRTCGALLF